MTLAGLVQRTRRMRLAMQGIDLDRSCTLGANVTIGGSVSGAIQIGPECELCKGVELAPWGGRITLGRRVFLGPYVVIYGHGGVEIGDHTLVAMHSCIVASNHARAPRGSLIRNEPDLPIPVKIGRDVWLGAGVKVLGGVTIGDGSIVGAGAVVTRSLPPFSIAMGVPARVVGERP